MASLGLFLFTNVPKGNPIVPEISMEITKNPTTYNKEYLAIVKSTTEQIPISQIKLDFILQNYNKPVIVQLGDKNTYYVYPIIVEISDLSLNGHSNNLKYFNSSVEVYFFVPENMNFTYMSIIDLSTDSTITGYSSTGTTTSGLNNPMEPLSNTMIKYNGSDTKNIPPYSEENSSNRTDLSSCNTTLTYLNGRNSECIEFNSSKFNKTTLSGEKQFWKQNSSFPYGVLNENSSQYYGKGYGFSSKTIFYANESGKYNLSLCTSEPVYIKISNSTMIYPFQNKTINVYNITYNGTPQQFNESLQLHKGDYKISITYFYQYKNGILAFLLKNME
jgi:hypothetical protein